MDTKDNKINRRNFLKTIGAAGITSVFASDDVTKAAESKNTEKSEIPLRKLGKTGIEVPVFALGCMFNAVEKQIVLRKALQLGVYYWDTARSYSGGTSEQGIGKFLSRNPEIRKKLFLATKASGASTVEDVETRLQESLKRMNTSYIDLYYGVHDIKSTDQLTDELRQWAENAKKRKLIRLFGFTTHSNMATHLMAASKLDWIDAIMVKYNFREMQDEKMQQAIEACHKANIGLIAMKVQAREINTESDKKLTEHFLKRGFTAGQAKIKAVLEDKRISCACVGRDNIGHLILNVAAVQDKTKLTKADMEFLKEYAAAVCDGYCAGCSEICDSALPGMYVSDIMRYLMYCNSYGEQEEARELFAAIPISARKKLLNIDYSLAEKRCPQHLAIGKLVAQAVSKLA